MRRPGLPSRREALAAALALAATPALGQADAPDEAPAPVPRKKGGRGDKRETGEGGAKPTWLTLPPTPGLPPTERSGLAEVNGTKLFYAEFGAGETVLFLHGGLGSSDFWGHQIAALASTHHVIALDTRGHGRSPVTSKTFGFALFAQDAEALLDYLKLPAAAIVGWSDGGITGLQLAMTRPERVTKLFTFGANVSPDGLIPGGSHAPVFSAYAARCRADYARLSPTPGRWSELMAGLTPMWRSEPNYSRASLAKIAAPTTVAAAGHDEIIRPEHAERIARTIPGAKLVPLKDVSHFAMLQDPQGFNAALRAFIAG